MQCIIEGQWTNAPFNKPNIDSSEVGFVYGLHLGSENPCQLPVPRPTQTAVVTHLGGGTTPLLEAPIIIIAAQATSDGE